MKNHFFLACIVGTMLAACSHGGQSHKTHGTAYAGKPVFNTNSSLHLAQNAAEVFSISSTDGGKIITGSGSKIVVAPDAFVYSDGSPVKGNVKIAYREINSPAEIVASGLPMQAFYKGETGQFISDGMFEINANANGKEVKIADGKEVRVFTGARDKKSQFQYWFYNKEKGNWEEIGTRTQTAGDADIVQAEMDLGLIKHISCTNGNSIFRFASDVENVPTKTIPGKYDPNKLTLDLNFDPKLYPDLAQYSRIMWQYAGTDPTKDPENNRWLFQARWSDVKLVPHPTKKMVFQLTIRTGTRVFETEVRPVVSGKDLEKAQALYEKEVVKDPTTAEKKEARASTIEYNMYNAFNVQRMGVYNCDRFYSDDNASTYLPSYYFEGMTLPHDKMVYILTDKKSSVIQYSASTYKMRLNPKVIDAVFTVAENGAIAAVTAANVQSMRNKNGGKINLDFKKVNIRITGMKSLVDAIGSL